MDRQIYVLTDGIAVVENGRLAEFIPTADEESAAETILLGRVVRVVKGMQAAFVDIGQEKNGFLPLTERSATFSGAPLSDGMRVPVQVKKDAHGEKGAFLTRDISLCGQYVLVMPLNRFVGVSQRIEDEGTRRALKQLGTGIADGRFGVVLRQSAADADPDTIREEAEALYADWQQISRDAAVAHAPSVVYQPRTPLQSLLDDVTPRGGADIYSEIPGFACGDLPVTPVAADAPVLQQLRRERDKALQRRVWLDSGANLVIDPCEAMTVIDVNTAKFTGKKELEETLLRVDLEAVQEIARQIRLRNLSGIILIDMIDLQEQAHRDQVLVALQQAVLQDRVKTVVHGFTSLGLIEMTRKKSRTTLMEAYTAPCPHCGGSGRQRKEETHG